MMTTTMRRAILNAPLYATLLAGLTLRSALARPSFLESAGWELVDDEPNLRVETTQHSWASDNVNINAYELYHSEDGQTTLQGSATGERGEADVQLEYEYIDGTWIATVVSQGDTATGDINHQQGISTNVLSGGAVGAGNTARVDLSSGIDDCVPGQDCLSGFTMRIEGDDFWGDFQMSQEYEGGDGSSATTSGTGSITGAPPTAGVTQVGEAAGFSAISFVPTLEALIDALAQGTDGVIVDVTTSATVVPPSP